jgi:uncharacterized membrane protein YGL010W
MSKIAPLLTEYKTSHQNPTNQLIHWIMVPLIYLSVIGLLWGIGLGVELDFLGGQPLNVAMVVSLLVFAYYLSLSFTIAVGMLIVSMLGMIACWYLDPRTSLLAVSAIVFVISWIFQFIGHKVEGKKPSFFKDVQFFLIGPAWVMSALYNKLGVKY